MSMRYLEGLNDRQKEAVQHTEGPLLIVAGAGAGKTKTITHRIAHLIEKGVPARHILAVTFTNKAAAEMRERVAKLIGEGGGMPLLSTFHSLGVRLLREFHQEAGLSRSFSIWDRDDSMRALKPVLERMGYEKQYPPKMVLSTISRNKGDGLSVEEFAQKANNPYLRVVVEVWREYEKRLREEEALDFDDLLYRTLALLRTNERVRTLLQNRWRYITIDEYQDTNMAQYEIARLLAGPSMNICVVGDTDQNIYSWRGADIAHLLGFESSFPNTKTVLLEQNYRSTRSILAAANNVIEKNRRRIPKVLRTDNPAGESLVLYGGQNEIDEAWFIAGVCKELMERGEKPAEMAVLYRENFQSRALEEAMLAHDIPYKVLGVRFFERKEVKDTLSYLRAALNPKSRVDVLRIIGTPARGIGKVTVDKVLAGMEAELPAAAQAKVAAFRGILERIKKACEILPPSESVRYAAEESGLEKMLLSAEEGKERIENIHELVNFATRYDHLSPQEGLERLLEEAALQSDQDQLGEGESGVALMTVHASKGLEFDTVFVTGLEQGLFPSLRESEKRDDEEERRLFYVALTRARKRVFLTYANQRMKYGEREYTLPSEFIDDIDQRLFTTLTPPKPQQQKRGLLDDWDTII
ncbi:MAG TPA: UvrD-helicase domain-containing protein [Candidatus Paceibacterota bacterium]|nr:UvrD-helicase domain-containing protein [Candidatus Paceibacterota bacterium]